MLKQWTGYLHVGGQTQFFATMKMNKTLKEHDKKIIECTWDFDTNQWKFMRVRTDKSFPNSFDTACGVWESIKSPIHKQDLLDYISKYRWHPPANMHQKRPGEHGLMPPPKVPRHA
jgi:mRNA-capping enzyme